MTSSRTVSASVLYIGGAGRSGTTLLSLLLNRSPDCFAAGEITHLWQRGVLQDERCGCGAAFSRCEFWQEVLRDAFGRLTQNEAQEIELSRQRYCSLKNLPKWLLPKSWRREYELANQFYLPRLLSLLNSIHKVSGKRYVIDSSKFPIESFLLENNPSVDFRLIHMVRNCHAVVRAWLKKKERPAGSGKEAFFRIYHPLVSCSAWVIFNWLFERQAGRLKDSSVFVRYEDLLSSVEDEALRICGALCLREPCKGYIENGALVSTSNHFVSANPVRFSGAPLLLKRDDDWQHSSAWARRIMVELLAGPSLRKYRYKS